MFISLLFFFKKKTAYDILMSLVVSDIYIRDGIRDIVPGWHTRYSPGLAYEI